MPRGGARAVSGPIKGTKYSKAKKIEALPADIRKAARQSGVSPLDFMLAVMRDESEDMSLRTRMAVAAAPFVHAKPGDSPLGKKERQAEEAKTAGAGSEWGDDLAGPALN